MNRVIEIEYGNEFKINRKEINGNDFFFPVYLQALGQLEEIIQYGEVKDVKSSHDYLHNIIVFCGERGQGKSSAMLSFSDALKDAKKIKSNDFLSRLSALGRKFFILDAIDPTQMEDDENILSIILSRIFMAFKNYCDEQLKNNQTQVPVAIRNELFERFQKCRTQIQTIKSKPKTVERQSSYEETLQELLHLGDSSNLKIGLSDLLKNFFKLFSSETRYVLVLQIDDTDLNIQKAYDIVEDLRKYFSFPDVIILMASKIEQLSEIVEQQFRKDYATLLQWNCVTEDGPRHMAAKYISKLIPESRRIYLPEPAAIPDRTEEIITIKYIDNQGLTILDETLPFQESILRYILQKVGIRFATPMQKAGSKIDPIINPKADYLPYSKTHPIIPKTMRELVELLAFLSRLEDYEAPLLDKASVEDRERANQRKLYNLSKFELYFLKSWIPNNINKEYITFLLNLSNASTIEKHQRIITDIYDILENTKVFSLFNTETNRKVITNIKSGLAKDDPSYYSVGDVMDALVNIETTLPIKAVELFCFGVRTLYTITMYKLYFRYEPTDGSEPKERFTILGEFIGGDLFGKANSSKFFPTYQNSKQPRGYFSVDNINIEKAGSLISNEKQWDNQMLFVYESYKEDKNLIYKQEPSENKAPFSRLHFWVSIHFVRRANLRRACRHPHESYMLLLNMEYLWNLVKFQVANPDRKKNKADISTFLREFYKNAEDQLSFFEPVQALMREWFKEVSEIDFKFLDVLFSLLFEDPAEAIVFPINNYIKGYKSKRTLIDGMVSFQKAFDAFTKTRQATYDKALYQDFTELCTNIEGIEDQDWKYGYTREYHKIIQDLAATLDCDRGD